MKRKVNKETLGNLLVQSLADVRDSLHGRRKKLTVKTIEISDPPHFTAAAVHKLRDRLGLSQALFANLLGISAKLVQAWEAGTRTPSPMACRLLDALTQNPGRYIHRRAT